MTNKELAERLRKWATIEEMSHSPVKAEIDDLREAASALEAHEGWVCVKDRLPENFGMRCLVMGTEADTPTSANWNGLTDGSQQYWILDNANVQWTIELVSHWMPLPAAPKGKP